MGRRELGNFEWSASNVFLQKTLYLLGLRCFGQDNLPSKLGSLHYPGKARML
jgi:hypothetical protein